MRNVKSLPQFMLRSLTNLGRLSHAIGFKINILRFNNVGNRAQNPIWTTSA